LALFLVDVGSPTHTPHIEVCTSLVLKDLIFVGGMIEGDTIGPSNLVRIDPDTILKSEFILKKTVIRRGFPFHKYCQLVL